LPHKWEPRQRFIDPACQAFFEKRSLIDRSGTFHDQKTLWDQWTEGRCLAPGTNAKLFTTPSFEALPGPHAWLNGGTFIGTLELATVE